MAWMGGNWVPDGTPGATPGAPEGTTTPAPTELFAGFLPPFKPVMGAHGDVAGYEDANRKMVPWTVYNDWTKAEQARQRVEDLKAVGDSGQQVSPEDMKIALDQYREAIAKANTQYDAILNHVPTPTAAETFKPVDASTITDAQRLSAAMQGQTTVGSADLAGLQASAQGQGAVGQLAAARLQQALRAGAAQASGIAQGATGAARKGALRTAALAANRNAMDAGSKVAELQAAGAVQAQTQVAGLQQQRANLQGQLDQARAAGDQQAINTLQAKMADLDQQTKQFNATQTQTAATTNNEQGLAAQGEEERQRVENERLKLDASKAATDAAAGLLSENDRRAQLDLAYKKLADAQDEGEKSFWQGLITSLISRAAGALVPGPPTTPKAAHGGLVTKPTEVLVGEAGPEIIIPVNQDVGARLAKALSVGSQPFDRQAAPDLSALLALLKAGQGQPAPAQVPPELVAILAAGNARARKASY
jgi:hypothetical protein